MPSASPARREAGVPSIFVRYTRRESRPWMALPLSSAMTRATPPPAARGAQQATASVAPHTAATLTPSMASHTSGRPCSRTSSRARRALPPPLGVL
jgi:hypothetical protein